MKQTDKKPDVNFTALVLVKTAYNKKLINKKTYQAILKKYGGSYYEVYE